MGELVAQLVTWATNVIAGIGYAGVALLIALEAVFPPIPSEVILPLSGSLSAAGEFNVFLMVAAATLGSLGGASMLYGIGRWGGERRIGDWLDRYGKWLLLSRSDLDRSREWFARYGSPAVMIARVIPGMRSFVSVPAGLARPTGAPRRGAADPSAGLPVGLQLIAPALGEATMLRAAWALEQDLGLDKRPGDLIPAVHDRAGELAP
jgi:membrane protein YqaA with SNARE-associated domain